MLKKAQIPSQSIRDPKLHGFRYQECPYCTSLRDFRPYQIQIKNRCKAQRTRYMNFDFDYQLGLFLLLLDAQIQCQTIGNEN